MPRDVLDSEIRDNLEFLRHGLPSIPTAVSHPYVLAKTLHHFKTQKDLQLIAEHMNAYLGNLRHLTVELVPQRKDDYRAADPRRAASRATAQPQDFAGYYSAQRTGDHRIGLVHEPRFGPKHILAVLAHEVAHHYLADRGVRRADEASNEILTDLACAFLGTGHLLLDGYQPLFWTSNYRSNGSSRTWTQHSLTVGYVTPLSIRRAIVASTPLRGWNPLEVISHLSGFENRLAACLSLIPYSFRYARRASQVKELIASQRQLENLIKIWRDCEQKAAHLAIKPPPTISPEDARAMVELMGTITTGSIPRQLETLSKALKSKSYISRNDDSIQELRALWNTIQNWQQVLSRYHNEKSS